MNLELHSHLERFGLNDFRRGQQDVLSSVAQGFDTLAVMPTGSGKSLCYQLPSLIRPGIVLVISPLIALMRDQVQQLQKLKIPAGCIHSGQDPEEKRTVFQGLAQSPHFILYLSPERVQSAAFQSWVQRQTLSLIAIDEAHCMSQWGPDFRPDYHKLSILRSLCPKVPILALTATATPPVIKDIQQRLELKNPHKHTYGFYRPNLFLQIVPCDEQHKLHWIQNAIEQNSSGRILIYCATRKQCAEVGKHLKMHFDDVGYYHAGLTADSRERTQTKFESGKLRILAATNAFGMGIDCPDVRLVIHHQMPANIESYYQEIGRAGRDSKPSTCLLLYSKKDKGLQSYFIQNSEADELSTRSRWKALNTFVDYLESHVCRFAGILSYFRDEKRLQSCGHCDVCRPESPRAIGKPATPNQTLIKKLFKKSPRKKSVATIGNSAPDAQTQSRMIALSEWRKSYAQDNDIPAFVVFSNKTLEDLAHKNPSNSEQLLKVYGFGEKKVEYLGPQLLSFMRSIK